MSYPEPPGDNQTPPPTLPYSPAQLPAPVPPTGYPPGYGGVPGWPSAPPRATNGLAIASLVCSLVGLAICVSAPVGAILGHVARRQIAETGEDGAGMALAGIVVGWCLTGLSVLGCGLYAAFVGSIIFAGAAS